MIENMSDHPNRMEFADMETKVPRAITIGLSDPTGISGVQADQKTFSAFGIHSATAITGVMTGCGREVSDFVMLDPIVVARQIEIAVNESGTDAIKIGAIGSIEIAEVVTEKITELGLTNIVVDPTPLLSRDINDEDGISNRTIANLNSSLFLLSDVIVVDILECKSITGLNIKNVMGMKAAAKLIHQMGPHWVVVSGSEIGDEDCTDYMFDGEEYWELPSERIDTPFTKGSGAAYSAAITAGLAHGRSVEDAVAVAKMYVTEALTTAYSLENGSGSLRHLYAWWKAGGSRGYGG
jgi:hydroxymethylpyrimidine/phosphomethylpyrimidine kinase